MPYTIEESWAVVNETARIFATKASHVNARASGAKPPSASELYFTCIGEAMDRGLTKREAARRVAIDKPTVHQAYLKEHNREQQERTERERDNAVRVCRNRNR